MAIKDKDGNVYKLRGPNPLTKDMSNWDKSATKLINIGWKSEVVEDSRNPLKMAKENIIDIADELGLFEGPTKSKTVSPVEFINSLSEPVAPPKTDPPVKIEPKVDPPAPIVGNVVNITVDPKLARILKERGVEYYCAPVVNSRVVKDELYGSSYATLEYGDAFMFDAVIIDASDLQLQLWCVRQLNPGSIIYRKLQQGGERWWKIDSVEPKTGGYLCLASISDLNPDFS